MEQAPFAQAAELLEMFSPAVQDRAVAAEELQEFLGKVAAEHSLTNLEPAVVAAALIGEEFANVRAIGEIDMDDLRSVGVERANAKVLFRYLGGRQTAAGNQKGPTAACGMPEIGQMQAAGDFTVVAGAFAAALEGTKDVVKLSQTAPTVHATREWVQRHVDQAIKVAPLLVPALRGIRSDPNIGLDSLLADAAVHAVDAAYAAKVYASVHEDHQEEHLCDVQVGGSALRSVAAVLKAVAHVEADEFASRIMELRNVGVTEKLHSVPSRFEVVKKKLIEVQFHPDFKMKDGVKAVVQVCAPDSFLTGELMAMWNATSKQATDFAKVMSYAKKEVKKIKTIYPSPAPGVHQMHRDQTTLGVPRVATIGISRTSGNNSGTTRLMVVATRTDHSGNNSGTTRPRLDTQSLAAPKTHKMTTCVTNS
jgi:hypothetical protein